MDRCNSPVGPTGVVKAVSDLGLSFKEIQTLSADEKFNTIAEALGRIEDPGERARLGLILFDRTFRNIAPAIAEGYRQMADGAETSTRAQLDAIDALDDAWKRFQANTLTRATNIAGGLVLAAEEIRRSGFFEILQTFGAASITGNPFQAFEAFAARGIARSSLNKQLQDVELENIIPPNFVRELDDARKKIEDLSVETRQQISAAKALGATTEELTANFGLSSAELKVFNQLTSDSGRTLKGTKVEVDAYTQSVRALRDEFSGTKLANEAKRVEDAFRLLTPELLKNVDVQRRVGEAAEKLRQEGARLSPELLTLAVRTQEFSEWLNKVPGQIEHWARSFDTLQSSLDRPLVQLSGIEEAIRKIDLVQGVPAQLGRSFDQLNSSLGELDPLVSVDVALGQIDCL